MGRKALIAVLCCMTLNGLAAKAAQPANNGGLIDNVSAESAPPLYRNVPFGVYASATPYAAYSFNVPQFVAPKFNTVPLNQERILAQSTNNYLRDSYGQRFVEAPQAYAYKAALPQQFVPLQKLPAHLSQPLTAAAPNAQYGQATHFFGAAPFRLANLHAVSHDHASPFGAQPLVYAQNVRTLVASPSTKPQVNAQTAGQQQTSSNNNVYANFHQFWSAPKAEVAQQEPKISASDLKENQQVVQSLPLVHAPQQTTVTSFANGKKTVVNLITKPPVPLLDLTLLEPLTFENPLVPQHQHFLPKIHSVTYKKLPEIIQKNNQKVITIKKKTTKKIKKTKKPKVVKDEVEVNHTPSVNIDDSPEITYEINSPNYKETISEKKISYNKETHTKPVHVSYEKKTEMKPMSYSYGKHTQNAPIHYNYVVHSNEPAELKQAYLDENKEKTKHLIYHFAPEEQSGEQEEQIKSEPPTETVEIFEESPNENNSEEALPEQQKQQDHEPQHKQNQQQQHQHQQHHEPKHEQHQPTQHQSYEPIQHHQYQSQQHPQQKYEPQLHHKYETQQHHQYDPQQHQPHHQQYEPQQHHKYEQQQHHQYEPQQQQYEPKQYQQYEPQQHQNYKPQQQQQHYHHEHQNHEPKQYQHQKQHEPQKQKQDNPQHELAEEAYNKPNQNFREEPEPEHREVAYYENSKESIQPEHRQENYYQNPKTAYVDSREESPSPIVYKSSPQQEEKQYEAVAPEYEEDIKILPAQQHAPLQVEKNNRGSNKNSPQSGKVYDYPQAYYNSAPQEKSNRIIVKDDPPTASEEVYTPNEELLEAMVKKQEESEEDFEQAYKDAAYGFPAYDSPVRNIDKEKEIYNPANYGVPRFRNDFDEAKSQLRQYEPESDVYPAQMRSNYQDTRDRTNDDYYKNYADSGPQSLVDRSKKKEEYYDNYNEHKPQKYYANDDSDKQQSAKYTVPAYSYPGGPQEKQYAKFTSRITPLDEYNYAKEKPVDSSAFGTGVYAKQTQFLEPHYQYGFEPIRVTRLLDRELAAMASDHSPETVKKIYKENFYIEKSSTSNVAS